MLAVCPAHPEHAPDHRSQHIIIVDSGAAKRGPIYMQLLSSIYLFIHVIITPTSNSYQHPSMYRLYAHDHLCLPYPEHAFDQCLQLSINFSIRPQAKQSQSWAAFH